MSSSSNNNTQKSSLPPIQLLVRDSDGWRLYNQDSRTGKLTQITQNGKCQDSDIVFSENGDYFAVLVEDHIHVYDSYSARLLTTLPHPKVKHVYFSPLSHYIVSYSHKRANEKVANCWIWKWSPSYEHTYYDKHIQSYFNSKKQNENKNENQTENEGKNENENEKENKHESSDNENENKNSDETNNESEEKTEEDKKIANQNRVVFRFPLLLFDTKRLPVDFSKDEMIALRFTKNSVLVHDCPRFHFHASNILSKLDVDNVVYAKLAPVRILYINESNSDNSNNRFDANIAPQKDYVFATFALGKNGKAATVCVWNFHYASHNKSSQPFTKSSTRAFYGADTCDLLWNTRGDTLLALASSEVDSSGKSYYGHQTLYLLNPRHNLSASIPISEKGKLQEAKWHPSGKEFLMIDNHPTHITGFDSQGKETVKLGMKIRNVVRYSNDGRFMWCGGFGNLNGEMSFYDWKYKKEIGYNKDESCRIYEYSPDGRTFVTARVHPYRTVDNGYRIYKYNGILLQDCKVSRLYQIKYRPSSHNVYPTRSPSPNSKGVTSNTVQQTQKRYVPPHLRGSANVQSITLESDNYVQPKKQKKKKKKQNQNQDNNKNNEDEKNENENNNSNEQNQKDEVDVDTKLDKDNKNQEVSIPENENENENDNENANEDGEEKKPNKRKRKKKTKESKPGLAMSDNTQWPRGQRFQQTSNNEK